MSNSSQNPSSSKTATSPSSKTSDNLPVMNVWEKWGEDTWNAFYEWFWKEGNGNNLIKKLNNWNGQKNNWHGDFDQIRREKDSPTIYSIVVNDDERLGSKWKFCKVGYTGISTKNHSKNRMSELKGKVTKEKKKDKYNAADVLFKLPISETDSTPVRDTEERIRQNFGWKVDATLAEKLKLPNKTEWVLNSQEYLNDFKKEYNKIKKPGSAGMTSTEKLSTSFFTKRKELQFGNYTQKKMEHKKMTVNEWLQDKDFPSWLTVQETEEETTGAEKTTGHKAKMYTVKLNGDQLPNELLTMLDVIDKS